MSKVTLGDLSLRDILLENLPRLKELRDLHFSSHPEICIELPKLMTRYMKTMDNPDDPPELRAGKRLKYILENKRPVIEDDSLLAGTTTTKPVGVILYPDFLALSIWPELETVHNRKKNPYGIKVEEIEELNFEILFHGQLSDFLEDIPFGPVFFSPPCIGNDTIGSKIVASFHDGHISTGFSLSVDLG